MKSMPIISSQETTLFFYSLLLFFPLLIAITKLFKKIHSSRFPPLPPGPHPWPILGNILQVGNKPHITLTRFSQVYGPLFSLRLGTQLVVVGSSQEAAHEILKTHDRILSGRYVPRMTVFKIPQVNKQSLGWNDECDENWKKLRTLCKTELFSSRALDSQSSIREQKIMETVGFIKKREGKVVKLREVMTATFFNILSNILVSRDLISLEKEAEDGEMSTILRKISELTATPNLSDLYPILGRFDLQGLRKKATEGLTIFFHMLQLPAILQERRQGKISNRRDLIDAMLENGSTDYQIKLLISELLPAGTDSSSSTVEWVMAELLKNPKCMKKVQQEIATKISQDNTLQESDLPALTYLEACVKETLRLHPIGPLLLPHRAVAECQVMNYTIPKDSQVLVNFWAISRDPKYWEEPMIFNPERFLNTNLNFKGSDFVYIPFGSGRRICPGLPMAARHVPLVLACLIHFFDWSLPPGENPDDLDMRERCDLNLRKEQPLLLIPKIKK